MLRPSPSLPAEKFADEIQRRLTDQSNVDALMRQINDLPVADEAVAAFERAQTQLVNAERARDEAKVACRSASELADAAATQAHAAERALRDAEQAVATTTEMESLAFAAGAEEVDVDLVAAEVARQRAQRRLAVAKAACAAPRAAADAAAAALNATIGAVGDAKFAVARAHLIAVAAPLVDQLVAQVKPLLDAADAAVSGVVTHPGAAARSMRGVRQVLLRGFAPLAPDSVKCHQCRSLTPLTDNAVRRSAGMHPAPSEDATVSRRVRPGHTLGFDRGGAIVKLTANDLATRSIADTVCTEEEYQRITADSAERERSHKAVPNTKGIVDEAIARATAMALAAVGVIAPPTGDRELERLAAHHLYAEGIEHE